MPYEIIKKGSKYEVKTTAGLHKGRLHGLTTKTKAAAQMRLLKSIVKKGGR
jgi:hypothetical protein